MANVICHANQPNNLWKAKVHIDNDDDKNVEHVVEVDI
jgi:hypothetical protein